jgi:protein-tyrosine phosphatase
LYWTNWLANMTMRTQTRSRALPIKGAVNLRDLGGYLTTTGHSVRWNVLYRAGHLGGLWPQGQRRLEELGLHTLIDFRAAVEKKRDPDRLPTGHQIRVLELPVLDRDDAMVHEISRRFRTNDFGDYDADKEMVEAYRQFATEFTGPYRQFVHAVLDAKGAPVLWHCTAGKDRAGFASALVLRLLGVPAPIVMQDYLLSASHLRPRYGMLLGVRLTKGRHTAHALRVLMQVQERWLQDAFDAIDERWGSFARYAERALMLSPTDIAALRQTLLEPQTQTWHRTRAL